MKIFRTDDFFWGFFLAFVFLRPFISEYAFLYVGLWYSLGLASISVIYLILIIRVRTLFTRFNLAPFIFLIAILLSAFFSRYLTFVLYEIYLFIPNILVFYIASKMNAKQQKQLIGVMSLSAVIICVYSIYQYFFGLSHTMQYIKTHGPNAFAEEFLSRKRVYATFITPNMLASYLIMMFFVSIGRAFSADLKEKIIHWSVISLMLIALLLTKSVGGILAIAVGLLIFLWLSFGIKSLLSKRTGLPIASVSLIFILICGLFVKDRLTQSFSLNSPDNSLLQRYYYWKASLSMFKHFPFTGTGWRQFGAAYIFFKPFPANISNYSHNVFLQILTETGIFGFFVFLWVFWEFLRRGANVIKRAGQQRLFKIGLFCAGISFIVHNLVDLSFYFGQVALFWWVILGLFANFFNDNLNETV